MREFKYAMRGLRMSPGFAAIAILALAVGIGASTAVFSVVDLLLFRSLPYPQADRLVSFGFSGPIDANEFNLGKSYLDWREHQTSFESMTAMDPGIQCDLMGENPMRVPCQSVEANFLRTLGVAPMLGRDFTVEDDQRGAPRVALLGYALWKSRYGGDAGVVNRTIEVDGAQVRVIGVLPASFEMPQLGAADLMLPQQMDPRTARAPGATVFLRTFARLKQGESIEQARERLMPLFEESVRTDVPPMLRGEVHLVIRGLRDRQIHDSKTASWMLFGAVLALLALACANVTNLLLARAAKRRGEFAVRRALGANRWQLLRQMVAESSVLSIAGCALGCVFAAALIRVFIAISPEGIVRLNQASIDPRVLAFALGASILAAMLTSVAPAWEQLSVNVFSGRSGGYIRSRSRQMFVAAQVALSLVLLSGASLLARSLWNLQAEPLGFQPQRIVTAQFTLNRARYDAPEKQQAFYADLEEKLEAIPGVSRFALSDSMPPAGGFRGRPFSNMKIAGHPPLPENGGMVAFRLVTPGYFRALGIPLVAGRDFEERERSDSDTPIILSAMLARRMFGTEIPLGQQVDLDSVGHWLPIVGVAADVKNSGLAEPGEPEYYRLRNYKSQMLGNSGVALIETALDEATVSRWIKQQVATVDRDLPVKIESMQHRVQGLSGRQRFLTALIGIFAAFGLFIAAIGLYGMLSFLVAQRTREIGVRMALGATPDHIAGMLERQAGMWTISGIIVGLAASIALGRLARGALFGVTPYDPVSLGAAVVMLGMVALVAAWWPARRAAKVDPAVSLRQE